jgi:hypothetical protein
MVHSDFINSPTEEQRILFSLRLGNLVSNGENTYCVAMIDLSRVYGLPIVVNDGSDVDTIAILHTPTPIPLTEEWLEKFGFTNKDDMNWWDVPEGNNHKSHHIMQMVNAWTWFIDFDDRGDNTHLVRGFNYVHELQNLCHSLTGEELTINREGL